MSDHVHDEGSPGVPGEQSAPQAAVPEAAAPDAAAALRAAALPAAAPQAGAVAAGARPPRRWMDTLTGVLLCVAAGLVVISASPALLRAAGVVDLRPEAGGRPGGRFAFFPPDHLGEPPRHPMFESDDEGDEDLSPPAIDRDPTEIPWLGQPSPGGRAAGRGKHGAAAEEEGPRVHGLDGPHAGTGETRAQIGIVRRKISLTENPGEAGPPLGEIPQGAVVMVLKEVGAFALVAYSGEDGVVMGWAKKSEIAVR